MLSNILYVKEDFAQLSALAHAAALVNKFTPETCCIVGNYHSLKGAHELVSVLMRLTDTNNKNNNNKDNNNTLCFSYVLCLALWTRCTHAAKGVCCPG